MKRSKRYRENLDKTKAKKGTNLAEVLEQLKQAKQAKFDESVEVHVKLNIDSSKSDQQVRLSVDLPQGTGKAPKIAVFCEGAKAKEAKAAGAELVFGEDDIEKIGKKIKLDFDVALATPPMMPKIGRIAKILGPKGLMPSPKNETVTADIKKTVEALKKGKVNLKSDAGGCVHQMIGKISWEVKDLEGNYQTLMKALDKQKPGKMKGKFIRRVTITTTMGPGLQVKA